jgi:hypothetical protein
VVESLPTQVTRIVHSDNEDEQPENTAYNALLVASFKEEKMNRNVAALAAKSGHARVFVRLISNVVQTDVETRMISVQPITLSIA